MLQKNSLLKYINPNEEYLTSPCNMDNNIKVNIIIISSQNDSNRALTFQAKNQSSKFGMNFIGSKRSNSILSMLLIAFSILATLLQKVFIALYLHI